MQGINDTEDFGRIAASAGGIVDDGADDFFGVDEENSADRQCHTLCVDIGSVLVVDHVVDVCNFAGLVGDDGKRQATARDVVNILDPFLVRVQSIGTQTNKLYSSLLEFRLEFCECTELPVSPPHPT